MDSNLTIFLKNKASTLIRYSEKYKISTLNIIFYSIFLNAFAVVNLLNNEFTVFILLFLTAFYSQIIAKMNKKKYNDTTRLTRLFGRISIWIIFLTTFYSIYYVFEEQITPTLIIIFIFLGIACNINYSLKILDKIEKKEFEDRKDINSFFLKLWSNMFKFINKEKRSHMRDYTKIFDETMIVCYFTIIFIYLNIKKNNNLIIIK